MPKGIPIDMYGNCERCGVRFKLHGNRQKRCDSCKIPARLEAARKQAKLYYTQHKESIRVRRAAFKPKDMERYRASKRRSQARRRTMARRLVIEHYSAGTCRCACCGERTFDFLEVDHISGGGRRESIRLFGVCTGANYIWLVNNGFPSGYQILCANCNKSKGKHGVCVHQRPKLPMDGRTAALDSWLPPIVSTGASSQRVSAINT